MIKWIMIKYLNSQSVWNRFIEYLFKLNHSLIKVSKQNKPQTWKLQLGDKSIDIPLTDTSFNAFYDALERIGAEHIH